jgi:hypothetical protein
MIVLQSKSGPDSKLHLEVDVDLPNAEFEVEVTVRPKLAEGWPPGYSDLFNSIDDDLLAVPTQPPMPPSPPALEIE